jgi:hypothetical protein
LKHSFSSFVEVKNRYPTIIYIYCSEPEPLKALLGLFAEGNDSAEFSIFNYDDISCSIKGDNGPNRHLDSDEVANFAV